MRQVLRGPGVLARHVLALACGVAALAPMPGPARADLLASGQRHWQFQVLLDGKPIGSHVFRLSPVAGEAGAWRLVSQAEYRVTLLGLPLYRYRHQAQELWRGGCLAELQASTDDNGQSTQVQAQLEGAALRVRVRGGEAGAATERQADGCVMSYAYWHPALRGQTRLLNPQTGRLDPVSQATSAPRAAGSVPAMGEARDFRIATPQGPVDVRYQADSGWVGLDALVQGRYRLSYRLGEPKSDRQGE